MIEAANHNKKGGFLRLVENRLVENILEPITFSLKARLVKLRTNRECWRNNRFSWIEEDKKTVSKKTYWKSLLDSWQKEDE